MMPITDADRQALKPGDRVRVCDDVDIDYNAAALLARLSHAGYMWEKQ